MCVHLDTPAPSLPPTPRGWVSASHSHWPATLGPEGSGVGCCGPCRSAPHSREHRGPEGNERAHAGSARAPKSISPGRCWPLAMPSRIPPC